MRKTWTLLTVGVLALAAPAARAAEEKVAPVPAAAPAPAAGCAACGKKKGGHGLMAWLKYRPSRSGLCSCFQCPPCIRPPLWAFFIDRYSCPDGPGGPGCGPAGCAAKHAAAPAAPPARVSAAAPVPGQKLRNSSNEEIIIISVEDHGPGGTQPIPVEEPRTSPPRSRILPAGFFGRGSESR